MKKKEVLVDFGIKTSCFLGYQSDVNPYYEEILMFFFSFFS
jgi:hypothetical protein